MKWIDNLLNKFTMYFVVLWSLRFLVASSVLLSFFGLLPFKPINLIFSFCFIVAICWTANKFFAALFKAPANVESYTITALILFLILIPVDSVSAGVIFIIAGGVAMASKYLLAINKRHIFNPAAFALVLIGIMGSGQGVWWVGNKFMFPLVIIVGLLIIRKLRRFHLFFTFLIVSVTTILGYGVLNKANPIDILPLIVTSYPILFLGTVMLTEPVTTPPSTKLQMIYGAIVGFLSGVQFSFGPIFATPELALIIGNVFSYTVSFKRRLVLIFEEKKQIANGIYEFVFSPDYKFAFNAGQYLEWTLSHKKSDSRGIRRYFTIASAPSEDNVRLGIRIDPEKSSSFKKALLDLTPGKKIYAGELSGDFILPQNNSEKLVLIAGGIGITPMRSMAKSLIDQKETWDIVLFYSCSSESEFAFKDIFDSAKRNGLKTVYVCSEPTKNWKGRTGRIDNKMIKEEVSEYGQRTYYLSGPIAMVDGYKKMLSDLGISKNKIITDYFPGY